MHDYLFTLQGFKRRQYVRTKSQNLPCDMMCSEVCYKLYS